MYLPHRLMAIELKRCSCWKEYLCYRKAIGKVEVNNHRIEFLKNCKRADLTPRFLKFRIPSNGCFDENSVRNFQRQLLKKELTRAKENLKLALDRLNEKRFLLKNAAPYK